MYLGFAFWSVDSRECWGPCIRNARLCSTSLRVLTRNFSRVAGDRNEAFCGRVRSTSWCKKCLAMPRWVGRPGQKEQRRESDESAKCSNDVRMVVNVSLASRWILQKLPEFQEWMTFLEKYREVCCYGLFRRMFASFRHSVKLVQPWFSGGRAILARRVQCRR